MKLLFSVAALLAMTTGWAVAQQREPASQSDEELRLVISADTNIVNLAAIESVQKDLGVGEDVARKLTVLRDEYQAAVRKEQASAGVLGEPFKKIPFKKNQPAPARITDDQRRKVLEIRGRLRNEYIPKTKDLLSADQAMRLRQIWLQACMESGPTGFLKPDVAWELELTDNQKQALNSLNAEMREKQFPGGQPVKGSREAMAKLFDIQEEYAKRAADVLTDKQREALGKEFPFPKLAR